MSLSLLVMYAGCAVLVIGLVAHLLTRDQIRRIVSLNIASGGVMMMLLALAVRGDAGADLEPDPVPQALVLTGIIIMAAITGLALALARRVESLGDEEEDAEPDEDAGTQGGPAIEGDASTGDASTGDASTGDASTGDADHAVPKGRDR